MNIKKIKVFTLSIFILGAVASCTLDDDFQTPTEQSEDVDGEADDPVKPEEDDLAYTKMYSVSIC